MKKIFAAVIAMVCLISFAGKANTVQPLKLDINVDSMSWTIHDLPANLFSLNDPAEGAATEEELMSKVAADIAGFASQFVGRRYRYGSTGPKTFDCSGFTSYIFRTAGIELNRTSKMQYSQGEEVSKEELRPGDLMFFSSPRSGKGRVGHVAMVVEVDEMSGACTFIHASSSKGVSYQSFPDDGYFSRNFIGAKRVISAG